ncbi:hypothetical protein Scep_027747 [Stephania cephalantha]|uniref:Uncharacterized protein n=1 Tax=Stephania cephalantha TaxID=152367 RepID=A0AAP0HMU1_9MAGN
MVFKTFSDQKSFWLSWDKLVQPKAIGGLGFRNFGRMNVALLAKQFWRIMRSPESLLAKCLQAKYVKGSNLLEPSLGRQP